MTYLNHQIQGQGKPIVLIHGLFGSLENLGMVARSLAKNYQVISIDVRNHGESFHENSMTYPEMTQDVISLLNHLMIKKTDILGHSMGGKIAMQIALNHPDYIRNLIIADISPVEYPPHHHRIIKGLLKLNASILTNRKEADRQLSKYVDNISVRQFLLKNLTTDNGQMSFKCNIEYIANCYPQIMKALVSETVFEGKTLFIKGGTSDYITPDHRSIITQYFPNSSVKIIANAGHWLHAEKTTAFNKIINDFLS